MIDFTFLFFSLVLATFLPALAALYLVPALRKVSIRYLAAVGVGLSFWYFFDTMGDASSLGENNSLYPPYLFGGLPHLLLIAAFLAGVSALALFDRFAVSGRESAPSRNALLLIPAAVAIVMGVHGLGEGWNAASTVSSGPPTPSDLQGLIQAFGTFPALASYPVHKFLEASIVAILYSAFTPSKGRRRWEVPLLGLLFAGPSALGVALGYHFSLDTTYFFAFGVAAATYAIVRLAEPMSEGFESRGRAPAYYGPGLLFALALGMLLLYTAALLH